VIRPDNDRDNGSCLPGIRFAEPVPVSHTVHIVCCQQIVQAFSHGCISDLVFPAQLFYGVAMGRTDCGKYGVFPAQGVGKPLPECRGGRVVRRGGVLPILVREQPEPRPGKVVYGFTHRCVRNTAFTGGLVDGGQSTRRVFFLLCEPSQTVVGRSFCRGGSGSIPVHMQYSIKKMK